MVLKTFKGFFACKIVFDANHHYPENIQKFFRLQVCLSRKSSISWKYPKIFRLQVCLSRESSISWKYPKIFRLQNCLRRKSSLSWNYSKIFSPAKLSEPQIIIILKKFKDFFDCKFVLAANHHYPENNQKLFRLQNCLRRKSSLSWIYSIVFSPAKLS